MSFLNSFAAFLFLPIFLVVYCYLFNASIGQKFTTQNFLGGFLLNATDVDDSPLFNGRLRHVTIKKSSPIVVIGGGVVVRVACIRFWARPGPRVAQFSVWAAATFAIAFFGARAWRGSTAPLLVSRSTLVVTRAALPAPVLSILWVRWRTHRAAMALSATRRITAVSNTAPTRGCYI